MAQSQATGTKLSRLLKSAPETAGFTQAEIAKKMGYTTSQYISNWERGLVYPPMKTLKKLAEIYKIDRDELFEAVLETAVRDATQDLQKKFFKNA